jgi:hypothetical protein
MNKALLDKLIIPVVQTGILSIVASISGWSIASLFELYNPLLWAVMLGFTFASIWLMKAFSGTEYWKPKNKGVRAKRQESLNKEVHRITAIAQDRQSGTFHTWDIPLAIITRVAFHLVYMDGKLSYDYFVDKNKIISRTEMKKIQKEMLQEGFLENGRTKNSPRIITDKGQSVINQYSKLYVPTKEERLYIRNKAKQKENERMVIKANLQQSCNEESIDRIQIRA